MGTMFKEGIFKQHMQDLLLAWAHAGSERAQRVEWNQTHTMTIETPQGPDISEQPVVAIDRIATSNLELSFRDSN